MNRKTKLPILAASTMLFVACSSDDPADESPTTYPGDRLGTLAWSACPDNEALDCATLSVPMDYGDDQAGNIEIALNRLPAMRQPADGVLLVNGGGPEPSLELLEELTENAEVVPDSVYDSHDLIGFDPRGFGKSTPITCAVPDDQSSTTYLVNEEMIDTFVRESTDLAETCLAQTGDYLLHVGSMNIVRDMESIRQALGVEKISYVGISYGTLLGALYLQNYPDRSDAFVLDASVHPDSALLRAARDVQPALQENLEGLLMLCSGAEPDCDPDELERLLIARANALATEGGEDELDLLLGLVDGAVSDPEYAPELIEPLIDYLLRDEIAGLEALAEELEADEGEEDDDGGIGLEIAQKAIACSDDGFRPTTADLLGDLEAFDTVSDLFAEFAIDIAGLCAGWPESLAPLSLIATGTAPPSLVIGGTTDTTTPIGWSEDMAVAIGGYFLASSHDDHTVVYQDESECVDDIATDFLVDGQLVSAGDCL